jgi:DNA methylase
VTPDLQLKAGRRRLAAVKLLGWTEVTVIVHDLAPVRVEHDENVVRKNYTPSEAVAAARELRPVEEAKAKERMLAGRPPGKFPEGGRARDRVAARAGMSGRTLEKAEKIVAAAERDPKRFGPIAEQMDRTGKVERALKELRRAEAHRLRSEKIKAMPEPNGDHGVVLGDMCDRGAEVPDNSAALVFTDPPYTRKDLHLYRDLGRFAARVLAPGGSLVCYTGRFLFEVQPMLVEAGLTYHWTCIAPHFDPETQDPADTNEFSRMWEYGVIACYAPLLWFVNGHRGHTGFVRDAVYAPRGTGLHPWQKPVGVARHFIKGLTEPGDLVVDPFAGSGTTLVAAKELGRRWRGFEIDEDTVKSARGRLEGRADAEKSPDLTSVGATG